MEYNGWKEFGDVNPLDHFGIWIRKEGNDYHVIKISYLEEQNKYFFGECYVSPSDTWVDMEAIKKFADLGDNPDPYLAALGIVDYYGTYQCGGIEKVVTDRKDVRDFLDLFKIIIPNDKKRSV